MATTLLLPKSNSFLAPDQDVQMALPGLFEAPEVEEKRRPWPDLSMYGLYFGIAALPNGEERLVVIDEEGAWQNHLLQWGFRQSRWVGMWVKPSLKFTLKSFEKTFPAAEIKSLTDKEIRGSIKSMIVTRQKMRVSQQESQVRRFSWHPNKPVLQRLSFTAPTEPFPDISPDIALRQTLYLGMNYFGQDIFESGDGLRFAKSNDIVVAKEQGAASPLFLRPSVDDRAGSLILCASGLVAEILNGRHLRSEDFERYLTSIFGAGAIGDASAIRDLHLGLDAAMIASAAKVGKDTPRAVFDISLRLHEGAPSYFREGGSLPTPLPLSTIMQEIAGSRLGGADDVIMDVSSGAPGAHSWGWSNVKTVTPTDLVAHDIAVCGVFAACLDEQVVSGLRVRRADHKTILETLALRSEKGTSVFLVAGGKHPGRLDTDFKRILSHIGASYDIAGLVDVDANLVAPGNDTTSRLLIIGNKLPAVDHTFSVPLLIPVHYDYETLWSWSETIFDAKSTNSIVFGDEDSREQNRWQAPYIPASQVSEPEAMSPRNLLGPVRKALAHIRTETGVSVDEYVSSKLKWTLDELELYLSAEQVDATALAIFGIDQKRGFVEADQTGLGKGRVLAASMRYAILQNMPVLFLTEKADLFRDIYRDIIDIGSLDLLSKPFILNSSVVLRGEDGVELARSPKKEDLVKVLSSGTAPQGLTLGTYSQFNRRPSLNSNLEKNRAALACITAIDEGSTRHAVLNLWDDYLLKTGSTLSLKDPSLAFAGDDNDLAIHALRDAISAATSASLKTPHFSALHAQLELRSMSNQELRGSFKKYVITDNQVLKQEWIRANAFKDGLVIMDEAHIAAGPTSQTNANLDFVVAGSQSILQSSATFAKKNGNFVLFRRIFPDSVDASTIEGTLDRGGEPLQELLSAMLAEDGRMVRREHDLSTVDFKLTVDNNRLARNEGWANALAEVLAGLAVLSGDIEDMVNNANDKELSKLKKAAEAARVASGASKVAKVKLISGMQYTNFSSRFYSLNRAFMLTLAADVSADAALAALAEGKKPVITVDNTMESVLRDLISSNTFEPDDTSPVFDADGNKIEAQADLDVLADIGAPGMMLGDPTFTLSGLEMETDALASINSADAAVPPSKKQKTSSGFPFFLGRRIGFKDILKKYADNVLYGYEWTDTPQPDGSVTRHRKRVNLKKPGMEEGVAVLYDLINNMPDISISPLDDLKRRIETAGYSIGELSGRQLCLSEDNAGNHVIKRMPARNNNKTRDDFNNGLLNVVLLSRSGSTGNSMHSSSRFGDQSQRELIEMQAAADIVQRLQFWGRVNRKGQVCPPIIRMISSGLPGEVRLMSMQNAHLRKLSANTSGNSDNSALNDTAPDILNRIGNEVCYRWIESNPLVANSMGIKLSKITEGGTLSNGQGTFSGTKFVDLLTGRILMLNVEQQRQTYKDITQEFHGLIEQYELEGHNPLKASSFDFRATRGKSLTMEIPASVEDSAFNVPVIATELQFSEYLPGISTETLLAECEIGRKQLLDAHGAHWMSHFSEVRNRVANEMMPGMLSTHHETVEMALAQVEPNAIKNMAARINFIEYILPYVTSGCTFAVQPEADGPSEEFLITGLSVPMTERETINPSSYSLKVRSFTSRRNRTITLSSLMRMGPSFKLGRKYGAAYYPSSIVEALKEFNHDYTRHAHRVIMEGNLFRGAQLADKRKMGQAITYTDDKGTWHHAILLPASITIDNVNKLPVDILTAEMMSTFLHEKETFFMTDHFVVDSRTWSLSSRMLTNGNRQLTLNFHQTEKGTAWLTQAQELAPFLASDWKGSRSNRYVHVNKSSIDDFCAAFVTLAKKNLISIMVSGEHRSWALNYGESKRIKTSAEIVFAGADKSSDSTLDDLDAQLAAMQP